MNRSPRCNAVLSELRCESARPLSHADVGVAFGLSVLNELLCNQFTLDNMHQHCLITLQDIKRDQQHLCQSLSTNIVILTSCMLVYLWLYYQKYWPFILLIALYSFYCVGCKMQLASFIRLLCLTALECQSPLLLMSQANNSLVYCLMVLSSVCQMSLMQSFCSELFIFTAMECFTLLNTTKRGKGNVLNWY